MCQRRASGWSRRFSGGPPSVRSWIRRDAVYVKRARAESSRSAKRRVPGNPKYVAWAGVIVIAREDSAACCKIIRGSSKPDDAPPKVPPGRFGRVRAGRGRRPSGRRARGHGSLGRPGCEGRGHERALRHERLRSVLRRVPRDGQLGLQLFRRFRHRGHDLEKVAHDAVGRDLEDRRLGILVDGHDDLRRAHAREVLDRAGDTARDVEGRRDDLAGLPHLVLVPDPARVHRGARGAQRGAQLVAQRTQHGPALGPLEAAPASTFTTFARIFSAGRSRFTTSPAPGASDFEAGNTFGRGVATWISALGAAVTRTRALPEYTGRSPARRPPSTSSVITSDSTDTPRRPAKRGATSRPMAVAETRTMDGLKAVAAASSAAV